jgi:hypothetical protein
MVSGKAVIMTHYLLVALAFTLSVALPPLPTQAKTPRQECYDTCAMVERACLFKKPRCHTFAPGCTVEDFMPQPTVTERMDCDGKNAECRTRCADKPDKEFYEFWKK